MNNDIPREIRELVCQYGAFCAIYGLSWEETEKLFLDMLDAVDTERARGCTCGQYVIISISDRAFRLDHYDSCELADE